MTAEQLIADLQRRDVHLSAEGDRLRVDAPAGVVTAADRDALLRSKPEILRALAAKRPASSGFHYSDGSLNFGDVCAGWTPQSWMRELRRKADRCDGYRPDIAKYYRDWADDIERRLESGK